MTELIEHPLWAQAAADQVVAHLEANVHRSVTQALPDAIMFMFLKEPPENCTPKQFEEWNHQCDHCGKSYKNQPSGSGAIERVWRGRQVFIQYGCCRECGLAGRKP